MEEDAHCVRIRYPPLHPADVPSAPSPAPSEGGGPALRRRRDRRRRRRPARGARSRRRGRPRRARLPQAARRELELLGAGRTRRRDRRGRLARAPCRGHDQRRPRPLPRGSRRGRSSRRRRRRSTSSSSSASASTATRAARSRSASRAATRPAGSSTPAAPRPARRSPAASPSAPASSRSIELLEACSATSLLHDADGCHGVATDQGPVLAAATILATGGGAALWSRTTNPWGAVAAGSAVAAEVGAELGGLELCQFHPTALAAPGTPFDGRLITEAVRGEGAVLLDAAGHRFTDELAPRDQVTAAILDRIDADGTGHVGLDLRDVPLERFAEIAAMLDRRRLRSRPRARSGLPRLPLSDWRRPHRPRRGDRGTRPVRGRRVRLHRPARRQPARLQLAQRVLRVRLARGARGRPQPGSRSPPSEPDAAAPFVPPTAASRARLWELAGPRRTAAELEQLLDDPYGPVRWIAASALAREESRGVHRRTDFPSRKAALDSHHVVVGRERRRRRTEDLGRLAGQRGSPDPARPCLCGPLPA